MKQITEDYVNYEIAKLLKENGFKEIVQSLWIGEDEYHYISTESIKLDDYNSGGTCLYSAPTHQMALKWLREAHNIEISISYGFPFVDGKQVYKYFWCPVVVKEDRLEYPMDDPNTSEFSEEMADSYEQAVEAALKYALENLINKTE